MRATDVLLRRVRHFQLTTKNGPKDYYKGTRTGAMGQHTHKGGYKVDFEKVRTYVVPAGLSEFKLTPFVTKKVLPVPGRYPGGRQNHPISGERYLARWKSENGQD